MSVTASQVTSAVRRGAVMLTLCCTQLAAAGQLVVANDELTTATSAQLIVLPEGTVTHLTELRIRALTVLRRSGDTLVFDTESGALTVRHGIRPSELILDEPVAPVTVGPVTLQGIDVRRDTSLFNPAPPVFYRAAAGTQYSSEQYDAMRRLTFVGDTIASYANAVPPGNPFQPDTDGDAVPDVIDNCLLVANGPADSGTAGATQYDTDSDGFGNRCDADLNNDCIVNAVDLGLFRAQFFAQGTVDEDFNGDGVVNAVDLGILRTLFFVPPGPSGLTTCP